MGLCIELIRRYGSCGCERGPFAFEWDEKTPQQRQSILNLVRFLPPRNGYGPEHIDYTVQATRSQDNAIFGNVSMLARVLRHCFTVTRRISRSIGEDVIISDCALADCVTPQRFAAGAVYPDPSGLRAVSAKIPAAVVRQT